MKPIDRLETEVEEHNQHDFTCHRVVRLLTKLEIKLNFRGGFWYPRNNYLFNEIRVTTFLEELWLL